MKRERILVAVLSFACGFGACWLGRDTRRSLDAGAVAEVRRVEVTVPPCQPEPARINNWYAGTVTDIRDEEDAHPIARIDPNKRPMKVVLIARDGRWVSILGDVESKRGR